MGRPSPTSSSHSRSRSKTLPRSVRTPKKSPVARVASTLRRRRSTIRDRYEKALIQLAEKYLNVPIQGAEGLVFSVPEIPVGHSRESLVQVFNGVLEDMSSGSRSSNDESSGSSGSTEHSKHSPYSISPVSGPPVDLLSGDAFGPDDFDRYLGCSALKPLPAFPADWRQQQNGATNRHDSVQGASQGILIEIDVESPRLLPRPNTPPNFTNARPLSVDELFFGSTVRLSVQSLLSPPQSLPLSPPQPSAQNKTAPPSLSDSRPPSVDDLFFGDIVELGIRSLGSPPRSPPLRASSPPSTSTPPTLSHSWPPSVEEPFFGSSTHVGLFVQPLRLRRPLVTPTTQPAPQDSTEFLLADPWPKPCIFRDSPYPVPQTTQVQVSQNTHEDDGPYTDVAARTLTRRRRGEDLRVQANVKLTVTVPTPFSSPSRPQPCRETPTSLQAGHTIPRKRVAQSPVKQVEYPGKWRDYSPSADSSSPYRAFSSPDLGEAPCLLLIPPTSSISLIEEMQDELDKLMGDCDVANVIRAEPATPTEPRWSLLDTPIDEPTALFLSSTSNPIVSHPKPSLESLQSGADLFDNVTSLLHRSQIGPSLIDDKIDIGGAAAALAALEGDATTSELSQSSTSSAGVQTMTENRSQSPNAPADSTPIPFLRPVEPTTAPSDVRPPRVLHQPVQAPIIPARTSSRMTRVGPSPVTYAEKTLTKSEPPQHRRPGTEPPRMEPPGIESSEASSTCFKSRMNKATLDALINAGSDAEFQRAFSMAKKTKRESRTNMNADFEWQRWVDRDFEDPSVEASRRDKRRRREQARKGADQTAGKSQQNIRGKDVRRRSNLFEVLHEEGS